MKPASTTDSAAGERVTDTARIGVLVAAAICAGCASSHLDSINAQRRTVDVYAGPYLGEPPLLPDSDSVSRANEGCDLLGARLIAQLVSADRSQNSGGAWWVDFRFKCVEMTEADVYPHRPLGSQ